MISTLCLNLSAESRGAGSIPVRALVVVCLSFVLKKFPVAILYGVVICNFDEDLYKQVIMSRTQI